MPIQYIHASHPGAANRRNEMNKPYDCNSAYQAAIRQMAREDSAGVAAVTIEFVMRTTGLTKYMRVWRNDTIEILDTIEEACA